MAASSEIQNSHFIGQTAFGNMAGELRYERVNLAGNARDITLVSGDRNADAQADFGIEQRGLFALTEADFLLQNVSRSIGINYSRCPPEAAIAFANAFGGQSKFD